MLSITLANPDAAPARTLAIGIFSPAGSDARPTLPAGYADLDRQLDHLLTRTLARPELKPAPGTIHTAYPANPDAAPYDRVLIVGLGNPDTFQSNTLRLGMTRLVTVARAAQLTDIELNLLPGLLPDLKDRLSPKHAAHALADGLAIGAFEFPDFKGAATANPDDTPTQAGAEPNEAPDPSAPHTTLAIHLDPQLREPFDQGLKIGQGVATARKLSATPPNVANPTYLADYCRNLASDVGLKCDIIDARRAAELGMGGLVAVGRAGSQPPLMIILEHPGQSAAPNQPPLLLVGKTITFDTGGYSLKTGGSMTGMKYDKCGGMAVIGAMEAIARLQLHRRVVAVLPCAENMIADHAYRVDDVLTLYNGVTVEVTNTDAEGRLVLADALAYGTETYQPDAVVDLATLTGGVRVALGTFCAGLFCNDQPLRNAIQQSADFTGERVWQLPLWDDHRDHMTPGKKPGSTSAANCADLVNAADRQASPIQGAAFLSFFVGKDAPTRMPTLPWAHLDIAATATADSDAGLYPKGPTGYGVRLLAHLAASQSPR